MNEYPITAAAMAMYNDTVACLTRCREAGAVVEGPFHDEFVITVPDDTMAAMKARWWPFNIGVMRQNLENTGRGHA